MKTNSTEAFVKKNTWLALAPVVIVCFVYVAFTVVTALIMDRNPVGYYSSYNMSLHYIVQVILAVLGVIYLVFSYLLPAHRSPRVSDVQENAGITLLLLHIVLYSVVVVFALTKYMRCSGELFCANGNPPLEQLQTALFLALWGYPILYWPIVIACTLGGILLLVRSRHNSKTVTRS